MMEHRLGFDPRARFDWKPQAMALLARIPAGGPVVLVAPPGSGKTTLAARWAGKWHRPWDCVVPVPGDGWRQLAAQNPRARVGTPFEVLSRAPTSAVVVIDDADRMSPLLARVLLRWKVWHGDAQRVLVLASEPGFCVPDALARIEVAA